MSHIRGPWCIRSVVVIACAMGSRTARAQEAPPTPLDLEAAIAFALAHHPALAVAGATQEVRAAQVAYARTGYLPQLDVSVQVERGTGNVLRGALFAMPTIPAVSGPPTGRGWDRGAFGSVVGAGATWDVLGLVRQMALVDAALAEADQQRAAGAVARIVVAFTVADEFLEVLAREATLRTARAAVERARALLGTVHALVAQDLRPGAEESRAAAELALASTYVIRAERGVALARTELARALGAAGARLELAAGRLLELPAATGTAPGPTNPRVIEAEAAVAAAGARRRAVDLQYLPRLDLVGALWVRGSGLSSGGLGPSPGAGTLPDTPNWAAGVVLSWPLLGLVGVHAHARVESARVEVSRAGRSDVAQAVVAEVDGARAVLDAAREIAQQTPVALAAARAAEAQAAARYRAGLAGIVELAEAQRLLAQAEGEDAVARLDVRRAMLLLARAFGDLGPFVATLHAEQP